MKKSVSCISLLLLSICCLVGCGPVGSKSASLSIIYWAAAALSLLLLVGCCLLVRKKRLWFTVLFSSVLVVNLGYAFLAMSTNLQMALWANRLAYLGSVFLPLAMLMIILDVSGTKAPLWLRYALGALSIVIFLIAASPGILPIYYKEVSFQVVDGVATLVKVYGPAHPLYLFYLLGYFASMVAVILRAKAKNTIDTTAHAVILAIAVFVNIGVWFAEQLVQIDFEMLSISYIISELFLLGVHLVMNEFQRMKTIVKQVQTVQNYPTAAPVQGAIPDAPSVQNQISPERIESFMLGLQTLTPAEKSICDAYIARLTTKEVMANMRIKESTLKYHNRNLYSKLGVSSRKELLEVHKHVQCVKAALEDTGEKQLQI